MVREQAWERMARTLDDHGNVVIPDFSPDERRRCADAVWRAMDEFPEYKRRGKTVQRVLGGFGALGNPSSFHHPTVQQLRVDLKKRVSVPLFREYAFLRGRRRSRLEMLFDRLCVRCDAFGTVSKEAWHRDIYDGAKYGLRDLPEGDDLFGGWLNLSDEPQRFVGLLGSHKGDDAMRAQAQGGGFAQLTDAQIKAQRVDQRLKAQASRVVDEMRTDANGHILVPPGCMIVFFQRILHSVAGGKQPRDPQLRFFVGHRLTYETTSLFPVEATVVNNAVPRIPSGQIPPMYSQNHYQFFQSHAKYRDWGRTTFHPACLFARQLTSGSGLYYTPGSTNNRNPHANLGRYMPRSRRWASTSTRTRPPRWMPCSRGARRLRMGTGDGRDERRRVGVSRRGPHLRQTTSAQHGNHQRFVSPDDDGLHVGLQGGWELRIPVK